MTDTFTLAVIPATIAAVASVAGAYIGGRNARKASEIHVLVDGRLSEVTTQLEQMTGRRDELQDRADKLNGIEGHPAPPPPRKGRLGK